MPLPPPHTLRFLGLVACLWGLAGCVDLQSSGLGLALTSGSAAADSAPEPLKLARILRDHDRLAAAQEIYATLDKKGELGPREVLEYASVAGSVQPPQQALPLFARAQDLLSQGGRSLEPDERLAVCLGLGRGQLALNQLDDAVAAFQCALSVDPDNVAALNGLGVALSAQGHAADANATLSRALELDPQNAAVQNNLALERIAAGDAKGAVALLTADAVRASPTSVMNLALAHLMLRNEAAARQVLETNFPNIKIAGLVKSLQQLAGRLRSGRAQAPTLLAASLQSLALEAQP